MWILIQCNLIFLTGPNRLNMRGESQLGKGGNQANQVSPSNLQSGS